MTYKDFLETKIELATESGLVNEMYFDEKISFPARAYKLKS